MAIFRGDGTVFRGTETLKESFRPPGHYPPDSLLNSLKFYTRLIADFQVSTVYAAMKKYLPDLNGKVMDVGCGQSPYQFLIKPEAEYIGIDVWNAKDFGYDNKKVIFFDGKSLPVQDASIDHFICTETLEHTPEPRVLIEEIYRALKPNGDGIVTVPWSARYHYIPHDYFRFTPSALQMLFNSFRQVEIEPRGTDLVVIVSKITTAYLRLFFTLGWLRIVGILMGIVLMPLAGALTLFGHIFLFLKLGAKEDPLGYTIRVQK